MGRIDRSTGSSTARDQVAVTTHQSVNAAAVLPQPARFKATAEQDILSSVPTNTLALATTAPPVSNSREATLTALRPSEILAGRASMGAKLQLPRLVVKPVEFLSAVQDGVINVQIPMRTGAKIGEGMTALTVRQGTFVTMAVTVRNGEIDRAATSLKFTDENNMPLTLDGPAWFDVSEVTILPDGTVHAEVPCIDNPDITEKIFGDGVTAAPKEVGKFIERLARGNNPEVEISAGSHHTMAATIDGELAASSTDNMRASGKAAAPNPLDVFFDFSQVQIGRSEFLLKPGRMDFGKGAQINFLQGTSVTVAGNLDALHITVNTLDAENGLSKKSPAIGKILFGAGATRFAGGPGDLDMTISLQRIAPSQGETAFKNNTTIEIKRLSLQHIDFSTPSAGGNHHIKADSVSIRTFKEANTLLSSYWNGTEQALQIALPKIQIMGLRANLQGVDSTGEPTTLSIGGDAAKGEPPVDTKASFSFNSLANTFHFEGHFDHLKANLASHTPLINTPELDITLGEAQLSGTGRIEVNSLKGVSVLALNADEGEEWELRAVLSDAHFGKDNTDKLFVDLSASTHADIKVRRLVIGGDGIPVIGQMHGEIAVGVDKLVLPLADGQRLTLRPGTMGRLTLPELDWRKGDASPKLQAALTIDLGADIAWVSERIKGLEGAKIELDAATGSTLLVLDVAIDRQGSLQSNVAVSLKDLGIHTTIFTGTTVADTVSKPITVPAKPLSQSLTPMPFSPVRQLAKSRHQSALTTAEKLTLPVVAAMSVVPGDLLSKIQSADATVNIPIRHMDNVPLRIEPKTTQEEHGWFFEESYHSTEKHGLEADLRLSRPAGDLIVKVYADDSYVGKKTTAIIFDPPLSIQGQGTLHDLSWDGIALPGTDTSLFSGSLALDFKSDIDVELIELRLVDDDGELTLIPVFNRYDGKAFDLADSTDYTRQWLNGKIGDAVMMALFAGQVPPTQIGDLIAFLAADPEAKATAKTKKTRTTMPWLKEQLALGEAAPKTSPQASVPATEPAKTSSTVTLQKDMQVQLEHILDDYIALDKLSFSVNNTAFDATTLDLGGGQTIGFTGSTKLTLSGTPQDYTLSGQVDFKKLKLGNEELGIQIDHGLANITIHVQKDPIERVEIVITSDTDTTQGASTLFTENLNVTSKSGTLHSTLTNANVTSGKIRVILFKDEPPKIELDLLGASATLHSTGAAAISEHQGDIRALDATVTGELHLVNGLVSGVFTQVDIVGDGMRYTQNIKNTQDRKIGEVERLRISGGAKLTTTADGTMFFSTLETHMPIDISTKMTLPDGSQIEVKEGHVQSIAIGPDGSLLKLQGLQAELSIVAPVGINKETIFDLKHALVTGSLSFGAEGIQSDGELTMQEIDGTLTGLNFATERSQLPVRQLAFTGDGYLQIDPHTGWNIRSDATLSGEIHGITGRAVFDAASINVQNPAADLHLEAGAQISFHMGALGFGGEDDAFMVDLWNTQLDAKLAKGSQVTVAPTGSAMENLKLEKGTRLSLKFPSFYLSSGQRYGEHLAFFGEVRLEGRGTGENSASMLREMQNTFSDNLAVNDVTLDAHFRAFFTMNILDGAGRIEVAADISGGAKAHGEKHINPRHLLTELHKNKKPENAAAHKSTRINNATPPQPPLIPELPER